MSNVMAIERCSWPRDFSGPLNGSGQKRFPVTVTACVMERLPAVMTGSLPSLGEGKGRQPAPVRTLDIVLKGNREVNVDGRAVAIPFGTKKKITVRALKKLAKGYLGSIVLARRGNSWVRLRDDEAVEIPEAGGRLEMKSLPSFQLE